MSGAGHTLLDVDTKLCERAGLVLERHHHERHEPRVRSIAANPPRHWPGRCGQARQLRHLCDRLKRVPGRWVKLRLGGYVCLVGL